MNNKKTIIISIILLLALVGYSFATPASVIGWVASFKDGSWQMKALCTAQATACETMQWMTDPEGKITSETLGGFKSALGREGSQAVDMAMAAENGVLTQTAMNQILKAQNPELYATFNGLKNLQKEASLEEMKVEFDNNGEVQKFDKIKIGEQVDLSVLLNKEKGKGLEANDIEAEKKEGEDLKLKFEKDGKLQYIILRDEKGESTNIIYNMEDGYVKIDKNEEGEHQVTELKGKTTGETSFFLNIGGQEVKGTFPEDTKIEYKDGELKIPDAEGKSITLQEKDEEGNLGEPITFTSYMSGACKPAVDEPTKQEGCGELKMARDDAGLLIITGNAEIEQQGKKVKIEAWGFKPPQVRLEDDNAYSLQTRSTEIIDGKEIYGGKENTVVRFAPPGEKPRTVAELMKDYEKRIKELTKRFEQGRTKEEVTEEKGRVESLGPFDWNTNDYIFKSEDQIGETTITSGEVSYSSYEGIMGGNFENFITLNQESGISTVEKDKKGEIKKIEVIKSQEDGGKTKLISPSFMAGIERGDIYTPSTLAGETRRLIESFIPSWEQTGLDADDYIAYRVEKFREEERKQKEKTVEEKPKQIEEELDLGELDADGYALHLVEKFREGQSLAYKTIEIEKYGEVESGGLYQTKYKGTIDYYAEKNLIEVLGRKPTTKEIRDYSDKLIEHNNIEDPTQIKVGQTIELPPLEIVKTEVAVMNPLENKQYKFITYYSGSTSCCVGNTIGDTPVEALSGETPTQISGQAVLGEGCKGEVKRFQSAFGGEGIRIKIPQQEITKDLTTNMVTKIETDSSGKNFYIEKDGKKFRVTQFSSGDVQLYDENGDYVTLTGEDSKALKQLIKDSGEQGEGRIYITDSLTLRRVAASEWPDRDKLQEAYNKAKANPTDENLQELSRLEREFEEWEEKQ